MTEQSFKQSFKLLVISPFHLSFIIYSLSLLYLFLKIKLIFLPMIESRKITRAEIISSISLGKIYFIVSMVKFPIVISRNGILNGILAIFLVGGICSAIANYLLSKIKVEENSFAGISKQLMGRFHTNVRIVMFLFRCIALFYMVEVSKLLLTSMGLGFFINLKHSSVVLIAILLIVTFLIPDPDVFISNLSRNTITFIILAISTSVMALSNYTSNIKNINFYNPVENSFDSFALTFICFAQQIGTAPLLLADTGNSKAFQVILGSLISSIAYILIGITGYLSCPKPNLIWCSSVENNEIRIFASIVLFTMNVLQFPVVFNPIRDDLKTFFKMNGNTNLLTAILTIILTWIGLEVAPTKGLALMCLIVSSMILNVFPSIFHLRSKDNSKVAKTLACINLGIGGYFILKTLLDAAKLLSNKF